MSLDELLAAVASDLRAIGHGDDLAALDGDAQRARILADAGASIHPTGRRLFLRCAASFLGRAFEARDAGDLGEADRWAGRAEAELERYRAPAPELHPYVTTGGAL
jgi:hypothetical protein